MSSYRKICALCGVEYYSERHVCHPTMVPTLLTEVDVRRIVEEVVRDAMKKHDQEKHRTGPFLGNYK